MTLVMNQLLDSKLIEADHEEEKGNKSTEKQGDDALVLWDSVSLFDTEDENSLKQEEVSKTNETTRIQGLVSKYNSILPNINKFWEKMKRIQKNNTDDEIPKLTIISQDLKQVNIEDKVGNVKEYLKAPKIPEEELPTNNQPVE